MWELVVSFFPLILITVYKFVIHYNVLVDFNYKLEEAAVEPHTPDNQQDPSEEDEHLHITDDLTVELYREWWNIKSTRKGLYEGL